LKILYHHRTASKDGQAVHITEMIGALRALGHEVIVVEPNSAASTDFGGEAGMLSWLRQRLPRAIYELLELAYNVPLYLRLRRAWLSHRPDVLYERHNLYVLAGAWLKRRHRAPYLLEVNQPLFLERSKYGGLALGSLAESTEHWVWRQADVCLPVTGVLGDILKAGGVDAARIEVVHNGIDPESFAGFPSLAEAKRALGLDGYTVLGFTGFVREWHGLDKVVDYMARSSRTDTLLLVVGDGPAREPLQAQAAALGIGDRVRFTGTVGRDRVRDYVAAFDVALQPAATDYASPLKLFEYLALGRAIVAPRQANILEILEDGENAVLFDVGVDGAMEAAIARLENDPKLRARLGAHAAALIGERGYTWRGNAERIVGHAEALVRRGRSG
jgi:glycosyltransferase involved in cell wall biosynthesis